MKKFLRYTGIITIISVAAFSITACGHHRHNPEEKAEWIVKKVTHKLDLNEDQQTKLKAVSDEFVAHHREHKKTKNAHMETLLKEVRKPELDKEALNGMFEEHQKHMSNLAPKMFDKLAIFHASLDDEQKEELADKLEHFKKHHSEHDD